MSESQPSPATDQPGHVRAEHVEISQGGAAMVTADTVTITQGGAGRVQAGQLSISSGGVGFARADELTLGSGAMAVAVVASQATLSGSARTVVLLAGRADGPVTATVDTRSAIAFGAAFAFVYALLRRIF